MEKKFNMSTNMVLNPNLNLNKDREDRNYIIQDDNPNNNINNIPNINRNQNNMIQSEPTVNLNRININNFENLNINNEINNNNNNFINNEEATNPLSQYNIFEIVGKGHFGTVRRIQDIKDGKIYALKEMDMPTNKEDILHLRREARIPLDFNHPNLIRYYKSFEYNGKYYFVAEFFKSQNLKEILKERKEQAKFNNLSFPIHFDQNFIINIFRQLLNGLIYLHERGLAHRDIKPDNILINSNNQVKITDFGLSAYLEGEGQGKDYLLGGKTIVGTASYGPPEIVFYENKYGIACDIFSLGYTIFELMNFGLPTETKNGNRNLVRLNNQDGFYDFYLADLVDRMYEHESYKRPTAKQCLARLNEIDNSINKFNNQFNNNNLMNNNMNNNFNNNFANNNINNNFNNGFNNNGQNNNITHFNNINNFNNNGQNNNITHFNDINNFNNNVINNNMNNFNNNVINNNINNFNNNIVNNNILNNNMNNNMNNYLFFMLHYNTINNMMKEFEKMKNNFLNLLNQNMKKKSHIEIKNKTLLSSMKCLLQCLYKLGNIPPIIKEIEQNLMKARKYIKTTDFFIEIFCNMYKKVEQKEKNLIAENEYKKSMNDFIVEIFDRQGSSQMGKRPIILYFHILTIINNEYLSLGNYINYNISSFTNYLFHPSFKQPVWPQMSIKITQFKQKYNNPFIYSFCFLLFSAYKCPACNTILEILPQCEAGYFLQLNIKNHNESLSQLIKNFFMPKQKNIISRCFNCRCNNFVLEQKYMMNSPNFLVLELSDIFNIEFETKIDINEYKATNEGPYQYKLVSVIIYDKASAEFDLRYTSSDNNWNNLPRLSFNSPSMAIYQKIR